MRTAHFLDGGLDAPPLLRLVPFAIAIALNRSLRSFQLGPVAMRAQQAASENVDFIHLHGKSSSYCRRCCVGRARSRREIEAQNAAVLSDRAGDAKPIL